MQSAIPENDKVYLKRYLSQYYNAKRRQGILKDRLDEIQRELKSPGVPSHNISGVPVKKSVSEVPPLLIKLSEIEERINRQVEVEANAILDVMQALDFLPPDSTEKEIMELRHIDCRSWNEIMRKTHFSRAQCYRYYTIGLEKLYSFKKVQKSVSDFRERQIRIEKDGY